MASWDVWRTAQPDLEIHGTEGSLSLPHPNWHGGPLKYARPGGDWEDVSLDGEPMARPNWPPHNPERANYRGIGIAEMIDAMESGRAPSHVRAARLPRGRMRRRDRRRRHEWHHRQTYRKAGPPVAVFRR